MLSSSLKDRPYAHIMPDLSASLNSNNPLNYSDAFLTLAAQEKVRQNNLSFYDRMTQNKWDKLYFGMASLNIPLTAVTYYYANISSTSINSVPARQLLGADCAAINITFNTIYLAKMIAQTIQLLRSCYSKGWRAISPNPFEAFLLIALVPLVILLGFSASLFYAPSTHEGNVAAQEADLNYLSPGNESLFVNLFELVNAIVCFPAMHGLFKWLLDKKFRTPEQKAWMTLQAKFSEEIKTALLSKDRALEERIFQKLLQLDPTSWDSFTQSAKTADHYSKNSALSSRSCGDKAWAIIAPTLAYGTAGSFWLATTGLVTTAVDDPELWVVWRYLAKLSFADNFYGALGHNLINMVFACANGLNGINLARLLYTRVRYNRDEARVLSIIAIVATIVAILGSGGTSFAQAGDGTPGAPWQNVSYVPTGLNLGAGVSAVFVNSGEAMFPCYNLMLLLLTFLVAIPGAIWHCSWTREPTIAGEDLSKTYAITEAEKLFQASDATSYSGLKTTFWDKVSKLSPELRDSQRNSLLEGTYEFELPSYENPYDTQVPPV
ncbi:MAG: hypothetical protein Q7V63_07320 [Gammaproteobacteria bacterium]|nr:hypothetical protein [Gammaproteobacteria bacterium]